MALIPTSAQRIVVMGHPRRVASWPASVDFPTKSESSILVIIHP